MIILIGRALIEILTALRRKAVDHKDTLKIINDQMKRFSNHCSNRIELDFSYYNIFKSQNLRIRRFEASFKPDFMK